MGSSNAVKQQVSEPEAILTFTKSKQQTDVVTIVNNAAQCLAPVWSLKTFIACNPLKGFEFMPFEEALSEGGRLFDSQQAGPKLERVNRALIKWCGVLLDVGQATIKAPNRDKGFYAAFVSLCLFDRTLHGGCKKIKTWLENLPEHSDEAVILCLKKLGVTPEHYDSFIKATLAFLPGWAGYVKWRSEVKCLEKDDGFCPVTLVDFVAVRLILTLVLWPEVHSDNKGTEKPCSTYVRQLAQIIESEQTYQHELIQQLLTQLTKNNYSKTRADVQLVFCIDVRSEPFRRSLESLGSYETFGFAGFFGIPARIHDFNEGVSKDSCPVLLSPRYDIKEQPISQAFSQLKKSRKGKARLKMLRKVYCDLKYHFATPFALVETLGVWCGLGMLAKTIFPSLTNQIRQGFLNRWSPSLPTQPIIQSDHSSLVYGMSQADQAVYGEAVLKMMGLTQNFSKVVVLCGHRSTTENNPYASALDCGACGGHHGGANAKILAAILNSQSVRQALMQRGIAIPEDTLFYAAEHDTTTDKVILFNTESERESHAAILRNLTRDLSMARRINTQTRCQAMGIDSSDPVLTTLSRSSDWAQVRPEWGLARNAAFIIGTRQLTRNINLAGRCFLHSYDWTQDEEGLSLETILTAPMVVAQWINTQYLFSTLDNVSYGSGSKITHNVTGLLGIMQGNGSDLMHGLPLQSVNSSDEAAYHQPQRLLTLVHAPRASVSLIIARQEILKRLFFNGWVTLVVIEPSEEIAYKLDREGHWQVIGEGRSIKR